ncbi:glycosyltransferase family 2 protein [Flavobacterium sp. AJR]|uniref:glycosyltransferase family 2 protein n=1 Tax=Flavobacterium sp. AJR TaxID=1979369 RepID=UPI000A3D81B9|nr:glycosyltransferase family 2 protein [Flavobacterium sp. AJR]OUL63004.1 hypothetical protein B8T70_07035 [Flavobacterium sp. AJR]
MVEKLPLVSVIVICYNQEKTIGRTLDSIIGQQTNYTFEIVIGEDASPSDKTREVCESYAAKFSNLIRLLPREANKGILKNYLDCVNQAKGKYIATCAGDDWWNNSEKLQVQVDFLENNIEYGVVYTNFSSINIDNGQFVEFVNDPENLSYYPSGNIYKELLLGNRIAACTVVFKRELFMQNVDLLSYKSMNFCMEDYPMWLEFANHTKFKYLPIPTSTYTISNGSLSNHEGLQKLEEFEENCNLIRKYFIRKYPIDGINEEYLNNFHYRSMTFKAILKGSYKEAYNFAKKNSEKTFKQYVAKVMCSNIILSRLFAIYLKKAQRL